MFCWVLGGMWQHIYRVRWQGLNLNPITVSVGIRIVVEVTPESTSTIS